MKLDSLGFLGSHLDINADSDTPTVAVLLATHHPDDYITEQIQSIRGQNGVTLKIYWGDYESSESNLQRVRALLKGLDYQEFRVGKPGPAANFFTLLERCSENFIAFSDQDDIWYPNKLISQVEILKKDPQTPALVHSNSQLLVKGAITNKSILCNGHAFHDLAFTNCCQGCTMMINRAARDVIVRHIPEDVIWHDWWIALVVSLTGRIHFSSNAEVLYRLHSKNHTGMPTTRERIRGAFNRDPGVASRQIRTCLDYYGNREYTSSKEIKLINNLISPSQAIRLVASLRDHKRRRKITEDILRRVMNTLRQP